MKKIIVLLVLALTISTVALAQTKNKVEKTSTVQQKVHNTFSKHKHYSGYKSKHVGNGHKRKHKHTRTKNLVKRD